MQWGIQNFPPSTLRDLLKTCERRRYKKPRVYHSDYSMLSQSSSTNNVFNLVRRNDMIFHAHAATADGVLHDRPANNSNNNNSGVSAPTKGAAPQRKSANYDTPGVRTTVARLEDTGRKHDISPQAIGLRWLAYHSQLGPDDGIVLSATSLEELERQVREISQGPLPKDVLAVVEELGLGCEKDGLGELR